MNEFMQIIQDYDELLVVFGGILFGLLGAWSIFRLYILRI